MELNRTLVIGMCHVPLNTLLASSFSWRQALELPSPCASDWRVVNELEQLPWSDNHDVTVPTAFKKVKCLSFYPFLCDRMLAEADIYIRHGFGALMLENVAAPYFVRGEQPSVIYWVMRALAVHLREKYQGIQMGIQILAHSDDWAMDIACRCGLDFIRCESALFEGVRPEGRSQNHGNLAKLYMVRQMLLNEAGSEHREPQVYVDIHKKHTIFARELSSLDVWLENILFQKIEGIIVTGKATGCPVDEHDIRQAREAIEKAKAISAENIGITLAPPLLIVGSGVSQDNIKLCNQYADAVIVGSSLKKNDYWENTVDENRVRCFVEVWHE